MSSASPIPHEPIEFDIHSLETGTGRIICSIKPRWASRKLVVKELGIDAGSLRYLINVRESKDESSGVVVRLYRANSDIYVDHQEQLRLITPWMHRGFTPKVSLTFTNGYFSTYTDGKPMDTKDPHTHQLIARQLAAFHSFPVTSETPQLIDNLTFFIDLLSRKNPMLSDRVSAIAEENERSQKQQTGFFSSFRSVIGLGPASTSPLTFAALESHLKLISWTELANEITQMRTIFETHWLSFDLPVVLSVNNMQLTNFLFDAKNTCVSILDFDHCSLNYCLVDVVSYFLELAKDDYATKYPTRQFQKRFLSDYLNSSTLNMANTVYDSHHPTDQELDFLADLCGLLIAPVHLYWALWAFLQALLTKPTPAMNYVNYGRTRLVQYHRHKENFLLPSSCLQKTIPKF